MRRLETIVDNLDQRGRAVRKREKRCERKRDVRPDVVRYGENSAVAPDCQIPSLAREWPCTQDSAVRTVDK